MLTFKVLFATALFPIFIIALISFKAYHMHKLAVTNRRWTANRNMFLD
jgi:hypothetical protein